MGGEPLAAEGLPGIPFWWLPRILVFCDGQTLANAFATCQTLRAWGSLPRTQEGAWPFLLGKMACLPALRGLVSARERFMWADTGARLVGHRGATFEAAARGLDPLCTAVCPPEGTGRRRTSRWVVVSSAGGGVHAATLSAGGVARVAPLGGTVPGSDVVCLSPAGADACCGVTRRGDLVLAARGRGVRARFPDSRWLGGAVSARLCGRCTGWVACVARSGPRGQHLALVDADACRCVARAPLRCLPLAVGVNVCSSSAGHVAVVALLLEDGAQLWAARREAEGSGACALELVRAWGHTPGPQAAPAPASVGVWAGAEAADGTVLCHCLSGAGGPHLLLASVRWCAAGGGGGDSRGGGGAGAQAPPPPLQRRLRAGVLRGRWEAVEQWPCAVAGAEGIAFADGDAMAGWRARAAPAGVSHTRMDGGEPVRVEACGGRAPALRAIRFPRMRPRGRGAASATGARPMGGSAVPGTPHRPRTAGEERELVLREMLLARKRRRVAREGRASPAAAVGGRGR